ncbi:MAG TPA: DUF2726 domain-containing protein [Tepidisphaeraceae bacterium]|nr:DUF2726 domain-containing protein [Tepidisphaeraceae bacterium]
MISATIAPVVFGAADITGLPITVLLAAAGVLLMLVFLVWLKRQLSGEPPLPYRPVSSLLTQAEAVFYRALLKATDGSKLVILAKVRLRDLVDIPKGTDSPQRHHGKVMAKHVDFVLCDLQTLRPLLVIELDDRSHLRRDRMERDAFVNRVMATINLPIWHIQCNGKYPVADLQRGIAERTAGAFAAAQ